jgi:NADH-quinone oxidoreductase subunit C
MPLESAVTDLEQLKDRPAVARLLAWRPDAVEGVKFDRGELNIYVQPKSLRDVCAFLRDDAELRYNFLSDVTCVDWYPSEPRFEVVYHLLVLPKPRAGPVKGPLRRLRLKVRLPGEDPAVESIVSLWPAANFPEREVFDLFGIRFEGHPYLRRILMPETWEGHPLRKDYPVEGYR